MFTSGVIFIAKNCWTRGRLPVQAVRFLALNRWSDRMLPRIEEARYVAGHTIWLRFYDGAEGEVDLSAELHGEVFEPLQATEYFRGFHLHPELHTITWPSGADFAPEFLRSALSPQE